jgi:cation:H+ antiporter
MLFSFFLIAVGAALLYGGGEVLVTAAKAMALRFGISPLVIGLTIVAFATSCPELAATITAALRGSGDMALGNAIGSNIANIGLILGISAMIFPLATATRFLRREVAFMTLATVFMYPFLISGSIERWHALLFLGVLTFYLVTLLRGPTSDLDQVPVADQDRDTQMSTVVASLGIALGVAMLVGGAQALVNGATVIARFYGVSDRVIGLTIVAIGTSLPELATSVVAARRREAEIILGNIIGSNIFNLLFILGATALVRPLAVAPEVLALDFWVLLAMTLTLFVLLATTRTLTRFEGAILLAAWMGYIGFLFL